MGYIHIYITFEEETKLRSLSKKERRELNKELQKGARALLDNRV